jgi:truncated hemoglobin YjbI
VIEEKTKSLFDRIGGRPTLEKVHKIFYDKIYAHPWIGEYFKEIQQDIIEIQQTDFMSQAMGGPAIYCGKLPIAAHKHMFINLELFELRSNLLRDSIREAGVKPEEEEAWMKIDQAFKKGIIKNSLSDCQLRFKSDEIVNVPNPDKKAS